MVVALPLALVHHGPPLAAVHDRANPAPYGWQSHVVRRGETVSGLSLRYRTTISALVWRNRLSNHGRLIRLGQKLWVPRGRPAASAKAPTVRPAARHATYTVRSGDTLSHIAVKHRMPLATLLKLNRLGMRTVIHPGDRLVVSTLRPAAATKRTDPGPRRLGVRELPRTQVKAMIVATARRHGVDPKLALAIGWQESGWQQNVRSSADAFGIMQVIPSSGKWASSLVGRPLDLRKAQDNVTAGVVILRALGRMADNRNQAIAGYYQGLGSVRSKGLYTDTTQYVTSVNAIMKRL